jgi:hypothetical protein
MIYTATPGSKEDPYEGCLDMRINHRKGVPIVERIATMEQWMRQYGSRALREERHLDRDSIERAYWNYGYLSALREALTLMTDQDDSAQPDSPVVHGIKHDISRMFH